MAKTLKATLKFKLMGGAATPAPPVGSILGPHQIQIMDFCKQFNALTADRKGQSVQVKVLVYTDKTFAFSTKLPSAVDEIRKAAGITKGSKAPGKESCGKISWGDIEKIASMKMADLNAVDLDGAKKIIAGSARSMGLEVV